MARRIRCDGHGSGAAEGCGGSTSGWAMVTGEGARPSGGAVEKTLMGLGKIAGILDRPDRMRALSRVWMPLGQRIVMVGGGLVAIELAEFLAERGRQVTILEEGAVFGAGLKLGTAGGDHRQFRHGEETIEHDEHQHDGSGDQEH